MRLYTLKEINDLYGIKVSMLKKLISKQEIAVVKVGVKNYVRKEDIEDYIERNTVRRK